MVLLTDEYFDGMKSIPTFCQGYVMMVHNSPLLPSRFKDVTNDAVGKLSQQLKQTMKTFSATLPTVALEICLVNEVYFFLEIDLETGVIEQFTKMIAEKKDAQSLFNCGSHIQNAFSAEYIWGHIHKY